jgi:Domain of Unknown Function (DUF1259)
MRTMLLAAMLVLGSVAQAAAEDWSRVDEALGRPGAAQPDGGRRYSFPRTDLNVTLDGVAVKPALALSSWLAFRQVGGKASVMGDLVLTEAEINPVMSKLIERNIAVTALHNHVLRAEPATMYMHVSGDGDPAQLAGGLREALALTATPTGAALASQPAGSPETSDPAAAVVERTLGHKGKMNGGVYQVNVPRAESIRMHGLDVLRSMGVEIAMNFQPTSDGKVAATGDFVLIESEVQPVLQALRQSGIEVTALHSHMLMEEPRLLFMHFWAHDDAEKVARGLKAALDRTNAQRG